MVIRLPGKTFAGRDGNPRGDLKCASKFGPSGASSIRLPSTIPPKLLKMWHVEAPILPAVCRAPHSSSPSFASWVVGLEPLGY